MGEDDKNADWQLESLLYDMAKDPSDARAVTQILMAYIRDSRAVQAQADLALRDMATRVARVEAAVFGDGDGVGLRQQVREIGRQLTEFRHFFERVGIALTGGIAVLIAVQLLEMLR